MRLPRSLLGASCGAAFATWYSVSPETLPLFTRPVECDAAHPSHSSPSPAPRVVPSQPPQAAAVSLAELRRWLERRGADLSAINFCHGTETDAGRFGIFANAQGCRCTTRGIFGKLKSLVGLDRGEVALAKFPFDTTLTATTLRDLPNQGAIFEELLDQDIVDDRTAVMLHLVVEKLRGAESQLRPWIALLPKEFETTMFWNDSELEWLKGTSLYRATQIKKRVLNETWKRLEPVVQQLLLTEGVEKKPSLEDFLWAYSIFWSRAISMPLLEKNELIVHEGVVPGLDFANHSDSARCRWTVAPSSQRKKTSPSSSSAAAAASEIRLVCPKGCRLSPGTELTINYGNKSNEELLFLYGFVQESNPHDVLMVACPIPPPEEWDEVLHDRIRLLRSRGLTPQVYLTADHLMEASELRKSRGRKRGRRPGDCLFEDSDSAVEELDLPAGVMETLEVFVMEKKDVAAELAAESGTGSAAGRAPSAPGAHSMTEMETSGLRLALLTTIVRLLELKVRELEGSESGTGSMEADEQLLKSAKGLSSRQKAALIYRKGQKLLARQYLYYTNALLQQEMKHLRSLTGEM